MAARIEADPEVLISIDEAIHGALAHAVANTFARSIDLLELFREAEERDDLYWRRDWHLRAEGQDVAARAVAAYVETARLWQ